jgi:hypothetical protein
MRARIAVYMSDPLARIQTLVARGEVRISEHGYDELAADGILVSDALHGVSSAILVDSPAPGLDDTQLSESRP